MEYYETLLHIAVLCIAIFEPIALFYRKKSKDSMERVEGLIAASQESTNHQIELLRLQFIQRKECDEHRKEMRKELTSMYGRLDKLKQ